MLLGELVVTICSFHSLLRWFLFKTPLFLTRRHNIIGKGKVISGKLDSLLYTYGGYWSRFNDMNDIRSWFQSRLIIDSNTDPRQVSYDMFQYLRHRASGECLRLPVRSNTESDTIMSECFSAILSTTTNTPSVHQVSLHDEIDIFIFPFSNKIINTVTFTSLLSELPGVII